MKLLTGAGYRTEIMSDKIRPRAREEWVQKRLSAGMQVLITNPSLVETGLDLNAFTTLVFYSMGYKLFTLRQASRRSWRINQTAPRVEVYLLYYEDTMQHKAMKLMASKLAVAGIIEGNFTEEGLAAMSDVQDMTSQMAKELMLGIRDNVEDIAPPSSGWRSSTTDGRGLRISLVQLKRKPLQRRRCAASRKRYLPSRPRCPFPRPSRLCCVGGLIRRKPRNWRRFWRKPGSPNEPGRPRWTKIS